MTSRTLVSDHADRVEAMPDGETFALTCPADVTPQQRAILIDHWHAIADELARRGRICEVGVDRSEPGVEHFVVRIAPDEM